MSRSPHPGAFHAPTLPLQGRVKKKAGLPSARFPKPSIPTKKPAMHDIKWIRDNAAAFDAGLARRGLEPLAGKLIALDEKRRAAILASEQAQARRNAASKEIGAAKAKKDEATAQALMAEVAKLKETMPALEAEVKSLGEALDKELAQIPNLPAADVPDGKDEHDNVERHVSGKKRDYAFKPKEHFDLGDGLGMMDFELAAKLSGARFVVLRRAWRGWSARSASSCSICTLTSTAIPKSIRRCWSKTTRCSARRNYQNSKMINLKFRQSEVSRLKTVLNAYLEGAKEEQKQLNYEDVIREYFGIIERGV